MRSLNEMVHQISNRYAEPDAMEAREPWPDMYDATEVPNIVEILEDSDVDVAVESDENLEGNPDGEDDDPYR